MVLRVFAVYDSKTEAYLQPFFMQTKGSAIRAWMDVVNDTSTQFHKHPTDFTLFEIAEYDDQTGKFTNHHTPISHGVAIEFHQKNKQMILPPTEEGKLL